MVAEDMVRYSYTLRQLLKKMIGDDVLLLDSIDSSSDEDDDTMYDNFIATINIKKQKKCWINDHIKFRKSRGEFLLFNELNDEKFTNYFRMDRNKFYELHKLINEDIQKRHTNMRESISSLERLAVTLRFLAAGDSFRAIAYSYRMGERTVSKIVEEVYQALWQHLQPQVLKEPNTNTWKEVAKGFKDNCQFDHCVGAIDGKHVTIKAPSNSGSNFFNYKKTFSIVLLAVVDSNRKFIYIDVGSMGRFSDSGILSASTFGTKLRTGGLKLPSDEPLYPGGVELPYVFVGDEAFPLMTNLMRAYPQSDLTDSKRIFNYRLCRARRVVENAFGILAARFRVFRRPFECRVELVETIVKATCVLHNYLIKDNYYDIRDDVETFDDSQLTPLAHSGFRCSNDSFFVREEFSKYFNGIGAVSWQNTRVSNRLNLL